MQELYSEGLVFKSSVMYPILFCIWIYFSMLASLLNIKYLLLLMVDNTLSSISSPIIVSFPGCVGGVAWE